jgi:protein-disulfide isomerase
LYEDVLEPILEKYDGKIRFASIQVNTLMDLGYSSVHASYCAKEQDKYWEMHKKLIERIRPFVNREKSWELYEDMMEVSKEGTPEYFTEMSKTIEGINLEQFLECVKSNKYSDKIVEETSRFQRLGFDGVPVIIINGKYFAGNPTKENLIRIIDNELKD